MKNCNFNIIKKLSIPTFRDYFISYGGLNAIIKSPYIYWALIISLAIVFFGQGINSWKNEALEILPNVVGFSIGAYAILLSFGDKKFMSIFTHIDSDDNKEISAYVSIGATFCHFIVVQSLTIIGAFICKSLNLDFILLNFIGIFLLSYSLLLILSSVFAVFRMFKMYEHFLKSEEPPKE